MPGFYVFTDNDTRKQNAVRHFSISGIDRYFIADPTPENGGLHELVVTTKAPSVTNLFYADLTHAQDDEQSIKIGLAQRTDINLVVNRELNKHLLHPLHQ